MRYLSIAKAARHLCVAPASIMRTYTHVCHKIAVLFNFTGPHHRFTFLLSVNLCKQYALNACYCVYFANYALSRYVFCKKNK